MRRVFLALLLSVTALAATKQEVQEHVKAKVAEGMEKYHVPGVSVAVIEHGEISWAQGYGVMEAGSSKPVTVDTMFQAASISKPVASMATLRLVQRGKLSLDTNVNEYLKSWKVPDNEFTTEQKVTLRRIMSHSAGLTIHGFPGYETGAPLPTVPQILDGQSPANTKPVRVETVPGTKFNYSGGGITIMQLLICDVTGKAFPDFMREMVLGPLHMTHSTYQQPLPDSLAPNAATAHNREGQPLKGKWHVYPEMAAAGLWTTPSDLARFAIAIQKAELLSQDMTNQMLTRQIADVGIGIMLQGTGDNEYFHHGGDNAGFHAMLLASIKGGYGAVIMTNSDGGVKLWHEVMNTIAAEYAWPDLKPF